MRKRRRIAVAVTSIVVGLTGFFIVAFFVELRSLPPGHHLAGPGWMRSLKRALRTKRGHALEKVRMLTALAKGLEEGGMPLGSAEDWETMYEREDYPVDPWGTPYRYSPVGGEPKFISAGPDRKFGTRDDISD